MRYFFYVACSKLEYKKWQFTEKQFESDTVLVHMLLSRVQFQIQTIFLTLVEVKGGNLFTLGEKEAVELKE